MTTGSSIKDKMVKGPRFFSVDNYPTVSFASTSVTTSGDSNKFQLQGNLTLLGVTKPVVFQVTLDRNGRGGGQIFADLEFDRRDFRDDAERTLRASGSLGRGKSEPSCASETISSSRPAVPSNR